MGKEKVSEIKFKVKLDENNIPESIDWEAEDQQEKSSCKSMMIALWDSKENNTLRIDLWTKEMNIDDMKIFFHQTLLSMADTFDRATGETGIAKELKEFSNGLAEKMNLIKKV